jgi:hypothetical protein
MPADGSTFTQIDRPQFSTLSAPGTFGLGYGSGWPEWQRDLYPVTYATDEADVRRRLEECRRALANERAFMFHAMRNGWGRSSVAGIRRRVDDAARYVRNCETQLRLIAASNAYLSAKMGVAA